MSDEERARELAELRAAHARAPADPQRRPSERGAVPRPAVPPPPPPLPVLPVPPAGPPTGSADPVLPVSTELTLPGLRRELEVQRLELARERLEVERLRLELTQLQGGAPAAAVPVRRGASDRGARQGAPRRGGKPGESQGGQRGRRGPSGPLVALGLGGALLACGGAAWFALAGGGDPPPPAGSGAGVARLDPSALAEPPLPARPPAGDDSASVELRQKLTALEAGLEALPADPVARRQALERLAAGLRGLRRSEAADALSARLDRLETRIESALEALPPAGRPAPAPTPAPRDPRPQEPRPLEPAPREPERAPPAPSPPRPKRPVEPPPEAGTRETPAPPRPAASQELADLLDAALGHYDARDEVRLGRSLTAMEGLAGDAPETRAVRGLFMDLAGRFKDAANELEKAGEAGGVRVAEALVRSLFATMRYEAARAVLPRLAERDAALWRTLIDGPFRRDYPLSADMCVASTDDGNYRVITDLGLPPGHLARLEQRLATAPEGERQKLVEKARKAHKGLSELCDVMDKAYKAYGKLLQTDEPPQVRPTVYVLASRGDFDRFSGALQFSDMENVLGYYVPDFRVLVFYDQPEGRVAGRALSRGTLEVLLHETFHQWLHLHVEDRPRWFDEGMAEYFGIGEVTASGLRYGLVPSAHPSRLDNIRDALSGGSSSGPMSIPDLLRAPRATFYGAGSAINYAQAWSFVHYLGSTTKGQKLLREYFKALRRGLDQEAAYREVFAPLDLVALEKEWKEYVGRLR